MSVKYMVVSFLKDPYGGGLSQYYYRTIEEARSKLSDLLATLPDRYDAKIEEL